MKKFIGHAGKSQGPMIKNEHTSKKVATIAADALNNIRKFKPPRAARLMHNGNVYISMHGLKMLAASALTQTKDKT